MKKINTVTAHNVEELAAVLGLSPTDAIEIELRSDLNTNIINIIKKKKLTHVQVAELAGTSRTRITAIANRNTKNISTDLMLRVLYSLGYKAKLKIVKLNGQEAA
jgi:predicted XRE-type DNA-binding protein